MDWEDIELAADWQGEERKFFEHCLGVWIDEKDGVFSLHDWKEHNPWQAEAAARSEQARQNAKSGWKKRHEKQAQANGNAPFLSFPNQEEIKESSLRSDSFCAELSGDTSTQDKPSPETAETNSLPVITLTLNTGEEYPVTQDMAYRWQELYPAVDVFQQLRNMRGWLDANPSRRKTKNGINKFINHWLADKQDNGGKPRASPLPLQSGEKQSEGDRAAQKTWENYQNLKAKGIVS